MSDPRLIPEERWREAAAILGAGGVVAVPTDTVYGLVCDPADRAAVERIFAVKRRPPSLELGILGASAAALGAHGRLDATARALARRFWPGPLSLIVPVARPGGFAAPAGPTVSLRVPDSAVLLRLLRATGPLASTSANRHGEPAAAEWESCRPLLDDGVDAVLIGRPAAGRASTIIDLTEVPPRVLRSGPIDDEALRPYLGG